MAVQIGVGTSMHRDPSQAGREAVSAAKQKIGGVTPDFVMLFATAAYDQKTLLGSVRKETGEVPLSGCSAEGVIAQGVGNESSHGVTVVLWKSDEVKFRNLKASGIKADSAAAGAALAKEISNVADAKALFIFPDGLTFNFDRFNQSMLENYKGPRLHILGGTASDSMNFKQTYQYHNGEVLMDGLSAALMYGTAELFVDVSHGAHPLGGEHTITKSTGNVIEEVDGKPALSVVRELLPEEDIKQFNLKGTMINSMFGLKATADVAQYQKDEYIIRVAAGKDDAKGSVSIYTEVAPGTKFYFVRRDSEKMMKGVDELVERLKTKLGGKKPKAILQFECAGRGKHMLREEDKLAFLDRLQTRIGKDVPWVGFYTFGEIAPVADKNYFHNFTSVVSALA